MGKSAYASLKTKFKALAHRKVAQVPLTQRQSQEDCWGLLVASLGLGPVRGPVSGWVESGRPGHLSSLALLLRVERVPPNKFNEINYNFRPH